MRKFLFRIAIFLLFAIIFMTIFHVFLVFPRKTLMTVPEGTTTVFIGNSTVELAVNDSLIPRSYNFARSAETFELLYAKLVLLKRYNQEIDTVIISFDDAIISVDDYVSHGSPKAVLTDVYSPVDWAIDMEYYSVKTNKQFVSTLYHFYNILPAIKYNLNFGDRDNYIGGFHPDHRSNLENELAAYERGKDIVGLDNTVFPSICRYYLDKIVEFCRNNHITLIFLSVPKHKYFWDYDIYREIHEKYYKDIPLIDCMTMEFPDSCYVDVAHLNYIGADIFSARLKEMLNRK